MSPSKAVNVPTLAAGVGDRNPGQEEVCLSHISLVLQSVSHQLCHFSSKKRGFWEIFVFEKPLALNSASLPLIC